MTVKRWVVVDVVTLTMTENLSTQLADRRSTLQLDAGCMTKQYISSCTVTRGLPCTYGHVLREDDDDWVKKCMEYEVEGPRPRKIPMRTWREVVREDCQARKLNKEDAMDRSRWRKLIKDVR